MQITIPQPKSETLDKLLKTIEYGKTHPTTLFQATYISNITPAEKKYLEWIGCSVIEQYQKSTDISTRVGWGKNKIPNV